jgi:ligand-binding sensor domain-containing protein/signal transduction histidine kinase
MTPSRRCSGLFRLRQFLGALGGVFWMSLGGFCVALGAGDYLIDVWPGGNGEKGVPNSSVTAIAQTPDGYLWAGTYNGLARFDGVRFVHFDPGNTPELKRSRIRRLYVDSSGTLWINTYDGSLTSYRNGQFHLEWTGDGSPDAAVSLVSSSSNRPIFLLHTGEIIRRSNATTDWERLQPPGASSGELCAEDQTGVLWCRGRDQNLWRFTGERFEAAPTNCGLQGRVINCLIADPQGRIWVGTEQEIAVWDNGQFRAMTPTNGEPALNVRFLSVSERGNIWSIANERVRKARGRQWIAEAESCRGLFTSGLDRLGMQEDRTGDAWLYHYGKGLFHIRADGHVEPLAAEENFPGERVDCFYKDRERNIWAGVDRGGLVRLRERRFTVLSGEDGKAERGAVSVAEDPEGAVWIGTYGAGLERWQDGAWQSFSLPGGFRRGFVFSVCPDREGRLWLSAGEEDLYVRSGDQFERASPAVHGVKAILAAKDGRVWVGTKSGLICCAKGRARLFQAADGFKRTDVRALAEDANGVLWAGAGDGTLYRVETNHVTSFQPADQWATQPIWSLSADAGGSVWVGTFRGGLLRFRDNRFVRYTSNDGLPDDVICQILDDGDGRLWIGSQQGIFSIAKTNLDAFAPGGPTMLNCTAYGRYDGLPSLECSGSYQPAAWRGMDGELFFATLKGVVSVQPEGLGSNLLPPPVRVEEVLVDGVAQTAERLGGANSALKIAPGKRQVRFRYTGLSYVSPDRVRFRYKVEGLHKDWIEAGTRREVEYSFLRPGKYQFQVTACNNEGIWNDKPAVLSFRMMPHFYETWGFLTLAGLTIVGGVAGAVRVSAARKYRRALAVLEQQHAIERDRARIAKDIHDDLGAGLTQITLLSELARREPAEQVGAHLGRISDSARQMTRAMDEIVWAVDPQADSLSGLMDYVSAFTESFLRTAGIRCRMDLPTPLPALHIESETRYNLFLALKEALNNIVKHARASEVWLRLLVGNDAFRLIIEDNGQGMTITGNGSGNGNGNGDGDRLSAGHGLPNLNKRLAAIGGSCKVESGLGRGTRVEMTVLLKNGASPILATPAGEGN